MTNSSTMESLEEEALFRSQPYTTLYFVQSPTTTVSNYNHDFISFHSPATQRRLTLSHYSSSRGSTNSFLHDKKMHDVGVVVNIGQEVKDGEDVEIEDDKEEEIIPKKKMRDFVTFSHNDSCVWIWFQVSLRMMVSFGVALLFFYLITKPPPPIITIKVKIEGKQRNPEAGHEDSSAHDEPRKKKIERINEFQLGEGVDNTGVTTKFLTCNCSMNLLVHVKSRLYGLHIHPVVLTWSFNNVPFATSMETHELYASSSGPTSFVLYLGTTNKPMYGAGRSMQDILDSGKGLSSVIHVKLQSRFHVVGKLIRPKYHHLAECILISNRAYDKQHKTLMYDSQCKLL